MNPNISAENLEDNYLNETSYPIVKIIMWLFLGVLEEENLLFSQSL